MEKRKIELNVTYCNIKKGIYGLCIMRFYRTFGTVVYRVVEDTTPDRDWQERKTVCYGSLSVCRQYVYERLNS